MKRKHILLSVVIAICAVGAVCAALYLFWAGGRFLPGWVEWNNVELESDLDGNGSFEAISLEDRQLRIYENGALACTLPEGWYTSDAFVGDLDSDGVPEIVCLTWKRGSFGESKPFWIKHDDPGFSQHVFIFHYKDGTLKHHWLSSDIGIQVERASLDPFMRLHLHTHDGQDYLCEWQDWGLSYIDEDNPSMREADYNAVSFLAVGDNIIHTGIMQEAEEAAADGAESSNDTATSDDAAASDAADSGYDFAPVYEHVAGLVSSYDMAAVNEETPLVSDASRYSGAFPLFGTPYADGDALAGAGFDIVEAACNHAGDQGIEGIEDTMAFWHGSHPDVQLLGLNGTQEDCDSITYRETGGIRFALFDYAFGLNTSAPLGSDDAWRVDTLADIERLKAQLVTAEGEADISICFLHYGEEYAAGPSEEGESLVESLIDAGADVVICTHPHVVQRTQAVTTSAGNEGLVCYSLGNFVSNQVDPNTVLGSAVSIVFEKPTRAKGGSAGDADAKVVARVASCEMIPTVCQVANGKTSVYLLKDYTEQMAGAHHLNSIEKDSVTLGGLREQWIALTQDEG